jgi:hypothetical protein
MSYLYLLFSLNSYSLNHIILGLLCFAFRVSFGSSKGSMVETLIYDSPPVQEEPLDSSDIDDSDG